MLKIGAKLSAVEDNKAVLYNGYRVAPISTNGETGNKRSGSYQLIAPNGARRVFLVADGVITKVDPWNTNAVITAEA